MKSTLSVTIFILLQLLSCYGEESIEEQNVSAYFTQLLQDFRSLMPVGIPEVDLPIMDPYHERSHSVSWEDRDILGFLHSLGEAVSTEGVMTGLSAFVIRNVTTVLRTPEDWAYPGADLHFEIDFPEYDNTGNYRTSGLMPYTLGQTFNVVGNGSYNVHAASEYENGTPFPWDGSSHLMRMSPWLNVEDNGTMWIQNVHGYVDHYSERRQNVEGIHPENPLIPITPPIQERLDSYGNNYMVPKIDQAGRNIMYKGLQDYIEWAFQGVLFDDLINGNALKKLSK